MVVVLDALLPEHNVEKYVKRDADEVNSYIENCLPTVGRSCSTYGLPQTLKKTSHRIRDIFDQLIPSSNAGKMIETRRMREDVSLIQSIVDFKLSLYTKQFSISSSKEGSKEFRQTIKKWKIKKLQKELHDDLLTQDNCILVWKTRTQHSKDIEFVIRVKPEDSWVIDVNEKEFLSILLDHETYKALEIIKKGAISTRGRVGNIKHDPALVREAKKIPNEWYEAAKHRKPIALTVKDGYHYVIKRKFAGRGDNGLCQPSMMSIYTDSFIVRMLELAEFTTAYNLKNLILHVKHGETVSENGIVSRDFRTTKGKLRALKSKLNNLETSLKFFTDHTVSLEYIFPPIELFKKDRFESVYYRIINVWAGLPNGLFAGGDGKVSIGSAFVSLKRVQIEGDENREIVSDAIREFLAFAHDVDVEEVPAISYDNDALRDDRMKLDIAKFLKEKGFYNFETAMKDFGYEHGDVEAGLKKDRESGAWLIPVFESSQGIAAAVVHGIVKGKADPKENKGGGAPPKDGAAPMDKERIVGEIPRSNR